MDSGVFIPGAGESQMQIGLEAALPKWTKKVVTETTGRDPLGLSRVSNIVTDFLLSGITSQTTRARYYSFYCWAHWHIEQVEKPRKFANFSAAFRRRESVIAMATIAHDPDTSPVGVEAARPQLEKAKQQGEVNTDFRVLPSNQLGGYGQYYAGSIYNLGLTKVDQEGRGFVSSRGEQLASVFHSAISSSRYIEHELFRHRSFETKELRASAAILSLDAIRGKRALKERKILLDLFFGFPDERGERAMLRRLTLGHALFVLDQLNKAKRKPELGASDWDFVYGPYYYDRLENSRGRAIKYQEPERFKFCHLLWRQFCLHQYFTRALELLLCAVLDVIGSESGGLKLPVVVNRILGLGFFDFLESQAGKPCGRPGQLLAALGCRAVPDEKASVKNNEKFVIGSGLSEEELAELDVSGPENVAAKAMLVLAVLYSKWRGVQQRDAGYAHVFAHVEEALWIDQIYRALDAWFERKAVWREVLEAIIRDFIVNQHDRVMYEKGRLDSCWISNVEGRLQKEQDYEPLWRNSRHRSVITILSDLSLIDIDSNDEMEITSEGKAVLERIVKGK